MIESYTKIFLFKGWILMISGKEVVYVRKFKINLSVLTP